jgi:hypothetical protein
MRLIRYVGVMVVAGVLWVVVSALLKGMGLGQGATAVVGFLVLFILGPALLILASGSKASSSGSTSLNDSASTTKSKVSDSDRVTAAVNATHEAAKALEHVGLTDRAHALRASATQAQTAIQSDIDRGGYSGEYRLLKKRTQTGGVVFWVRDSQGADDSNFLFKIMLSEAGNLPHEFRQRFLQGSTNPARQTFKCPGGGYELHVDLQR